MYECFCGCILKLSSDQSVATDSGASGYAMPNVKVDYKNLCLLLLMFCTSMFMSSGLAGRLQCLAISPATNAYKSGALLTQKQIGLLSSAIFSSPRLNKLLPGSSGECFSKREQLLGVGRRRLLVCSWFAGRRNIADYNGFGCGRHNNAMKMIAVVIAVDVIGV